MLGDKKVFADSMKPGQHSRVKKPFVQICLTILPTRDVIKSNRLFSTAAPSQRNDNFSSTFTDTQSAQVTNSMKQGYFKKIDRC
jgi:hypothetical protein